MTTLESEQKDILEKLNEIALEANWGTVERVNGIPEAVAIIQEAMEEIKALRKSDADLRLYEMQLKNGEIDMTVGSEDCKAFIFGLIQIFRQNGATNFFTTTIEVDDKHGERYALIIQKVGAESPAEQLSRIRKETVREILQELFTFYGGEESGFPDHEIQQDLKFFAEKYGVEIDNNV